MDILPPQNQLFEAEVASVADRVRALRSKGLSAAEIRAALPGTSTWAVNCAINRDEIARAAHPGLRARARDDDREAARTLRREGRTYKQIRAALGVSSGALSMWLRDLPHPAPDRVAQAAHMNRVQSARTEARRTAEKAAAYAEVGEVSDRELMLIGAALYWAEGVKDKSYARREVVTFINSDPGMIQIFLRWLDLMDIGEGRRQYRISIHESADLAKAEEYWRSVVGLREVEFRRATLKRHQPKTVRLRTGSDYHGCLTVKVLQPSTLYRRIDGLWRGILAARSVGYVPD
ncbi:MAG: hypothetical protein ACRDOI_08610 [Trebonia sp.]